MDPGRETQGCPMEHTFRQLSDTLQGMAEPTRNISGDSIKSYLQVKSSRAGFLDGLQPLGRVHIAAGYKCKREGVAEGNRHAPTADLLLLGRGQEPRRRGEKEWGRRASCTHEAAVVCCY